VLQSIRQATTSFNSQVNHLHKHPSAFNPKYIRVRGSKIRSKYSPSTAKDMERPAPSLPSNRTTRRRSDGQLRFTRLRCPDRAPSRRESTREAGSSAKSYPRLVHLVGFGYHLQKQQKQAANRLRFLNLSKTYPSWWLIAPTSSMQRLSGFGACLAKERLLNESLLSDFSFQLNLVRSEIM
jgi:hypothetical protein